MFSRILCAFKFTGAGRQALLTAARLAGEQNSQLNILHALDYTSSGLSKDAPESRELMTSATARFEEEIKPMIRDLKNFKFECYPSDPAVEICRQAVDLGSDLIVLGTHKRPGKINLGRIDYIGMTVLEKAPCPVLVVPFIE